MHLKKYTCRLLIIFVLVLGLAMNSLAVYGQSSLVSLRGDFPQLMQMFGEDLKNQRADYVFAIDVSGTMDRYRDVLVPALKDFFSVLSDGDYVSIIKFGGEAKIDIGGSGKLDAPMRAALLQYADHLYDKPVQQQERQRFYNHTDLDNMVSELVKDLSRTGRNDLKFVFIITDFEDDPSPDRVGAANWMQRRQEAELQLQGKNLNIVALNLPGSHTHIDQVLSVFSAFSPERQDITTGAALSNWFSMHKDDMMKGRFRQLIKGMLTDTQMKATAEIDRNGMLTLSNITWHPNRVFYNLRLDSIVCSNHMQHFKVSCRHDDCALPAQIETKPTQLYEVGHIVREDSKWLLPRFCTIDDTLRLVASCDVAYRQELEQLLASPHPSYTTTVALKGRIFNYPITFRMFLVLLSLLLIYVVALISKMSKNRHTTIRGSFSVWKNDVLLVEPYPVRNRRKLTIGQGADIDAPVDWRIEISVRKAIVAVPIVHLFSNPHYVVRCLRGEGCRPNGILRKGNRIAIKVKENGSMSYQINWNNK